MGGPRHAHNDSEFDLARDAAWLQTEARLSSVRNILKRPDITLSSLKNAAYEVVSILMHQPAEARFWPLSRHRSGLENLLAAVIA
jgi:hypothetical protein